MATSTFGVKAGAPGALSVQKAAAARRMVVQRRRRLVVSNAKQGNWLPGSTSPKYLDGSLPGDFGFDPLKLGEDAENLKWYAQAELMHGRFAMLGVLGCVVPEILTNAGLKWPGAGVDWVEAATFKYYADSKVFFVIQLFAMHWVEIRRWQDMKEPGSVNVDPINSQYKLPDEGTPGYPGGIFDPYGWSKKAPISDDLDGLKTKEIKNGRLAMVAFVGFWLQYNVQHLGPIACWTKHLADPYANNILNTDAIPFS